MKISVIIPAHNRAAFITTAIRSLVAQRQAADIDIVLVDDGSTDATADVVTALAAENPAIRLIRQPHQGVAAARNTGLANLHAEAGLVGFLDSDDACAPGRFATEIPLFRDDPQLMMTYAQMTMTDGIDAASLRPPAGAATCTLRGVSLTTAIFRRAAIEQVGCFDPALRQAEDLDYLLRFFELPLDYRFLDHAAIFYRRHAGNMTKNREEAQRAFMRALILATRRRASEGTRREIPKFFDITALYEARHAALL